MDIRIEKTDRAIEKAFLELRSKMPLEKIKIKDLCALACVNKSTFYAHYEDIYALSSRLEDKLIADILASVSAVELHPVRTEVLTRELFRAFVQNKTAVNILRESLTAQDPTFANDPKRGILLSFCVQGCFYAFTNNSSRMDEKHLVDLLAEIARAAQKIKM